VSAIVIGAFPPSNYLLSTFFQPLMRYLLALILLFATPFLAEARISQFWSYQDLDDRADLVVIGLVTSITDTTEATVLPYLHPDVHVIGESTEFRIGVVLKGDHNLQSCVLHHYRLANPGGVGLNGPALVSFDSKARGHYLLFLTHEADGRYAPVAGQVDSAKSIFKLESGFPPSFLP
jgi:hypothetical protein